MTITIAGIDFDYRDYDERSDVLYLHIGPPKGPAAKTLRHPRGTPSNTTSTTRSSGSSHGRSSDARPQRRAPTHLATRTSRGKRSSSGARGLTADPRELEVTMSTTLQPIGPAGRKVLAMIEDPELDARYPNRTHFIDAQNSH